MRVKSVRSQKTDSIIRILFAAAILLLVPYPTSPSSFTLPAVYQCTGVRVKQEKAGRIYTKGYQTPYFFIKISPFEIKAYGTHSEINICRTIGIKRIYRDTIYLEAPEEVKNCNHDELKLYLDKDTIKGHTFLYDTDTSRVSLKAIVKKLIRYQEAELEKICH